MTLKKKPAAGRPRLDHNEDFRRGFATVLPRLRAGDISQGKAARELGISVRSLKRYVVRASSGVRRSSYQQDHQKILRDLMARQLGSGDGRAG